MESVKISKKLLNRLPIYLNYLKSLPDDCENISATVMARDLNLGDVQVRKDLAKICEAGRKRTGRSRERLIRDIERLLICLQESVMLIQQSTIQCRSRHLTSRNQLLRFL